MPVSPFGADLHCHQSTDLGAFLSYTTVEPAGASSRRETQRASPGPRGGGARGGGVLRPGGPGLLLPESETQTGQLTQALVCGRKEAKGPSGKFVRGEGSGLVTQAQARARVVGRTCPSEVGS